MVVHTDVHDMQEIGCLALGNLACAPQRATSARAPQQNCLLAAGRIAFCGSLAARVHLHHGATVDREALQWAGHDKIR